MRMAIGAGTHKLGVTHVRVVITNVGAYAGGDIRFAAAVGKLTRLAVALVTFKRSRANCPVAVGGGVATVGRCGAVVIRGGKVRAVVVKVGVHVGAAKYYGAVIMTTSSDVRMTIGAAAYERRVGMDAMRRGTLTRAGVGCAVIGVTRRAIEFWPIDVVALGPLRRAGYVGKLMRRVI